MGCATEHQALDAASSEVAAAPRWCRRLFSTEPKKGVWATLLTNSTSRLPKISNSRERDSRAIDCASRQCPSDRELEVLSWFSQGKIAEDVAVILGISPTTVMFHYRNAAEVLGTVNRTHTVAVALRLGLID
jgi:DNA-binding CsgD family transcriptional regulator